MTKHFDDFGALALDLLTTGPAMALALHDGLERIGRRLEAEMHNKFGEYQTASGPFGEWAPLTAATENRKAALGQPADSPLVATGEMKNSTGYDVGLLELVVGVRDPKMVWHEFGTERIPPRPVVGPAVYENLDTIQRLVGAAALSGFVGASGDLPEAEVHESLGYRFQTRR